MLGKEGRHVVAKNSHGLLVHEVSNLTFTVSQLVDQALFLGTDSLRPPTSWNSCTAVQNSRNEKIEQGRSLEVCGALTLYDLALSVGFLLIMIPKDRARLCNLSYHGMCIMDAYACRHRQADGPQMGEGGHSAMCTVCCGVLCGRPSVPKIILGLVEWDDGKSGMGWSESSQISGRLAPRAGLAPSLRWGPGAISRAAGAAKVMVCIAALLGPQYDDHCVTNDKGLAMPVGNFPCK